MKSRHDPRISSLIYLAMCQIATKNVMTDAQLDAPVPMLGDLTTRGLLGMMQQDLIDEAPE